jgi:hypothetical protein
MKNRPPWWWFAWGLGAIAVGLAVWATTFVLVPAGVVFIVVGIVRWASQGRA